MIRPARLLLIPSLLLALPAAAEYPFRSGDFSVSPSLGVMIQAAESGTPGTAIFGIGTDFDYHLSPSFVAGGLVNLGFGSDAVVFDVGPLVKYKFHTGGPHVPYLKAAFLFRVRGATPGKMAIRQNDRYDTAESGLAFLMGAGYKYFLLQTLAIGIELGLVPSIFWDTDGGSHSVLGLNALAGMELRFGGP